jgi:hypothetical protein
MQVKRKLLLSVGMLGCQIIALLALVFLPATAVQAITAPDGGVQNTTSGSTNAQTPSSASTQANSPSVEPACTQGDVACNVDSNSIVTKVINPLIKILSVVVGVLAVIMFIVAGIIYSSAQDDPKRISLAKKIVLDVVIGLIVYLVLFDLLHYLLPQGIKL